MRLIPKSAEELVLGRLVLNFAAMVFLGVTGFLSWQEDAWPILFTLRGMGFVICGLLFFGGVIGAGLAYWHRRLAHWMVMRGGGSLDSQGAAMIRHSGTLVLLTQLLIVYFLTEWAFDHWMIHTTG